MGFAADLKGFVSGFQTGVNIGNQLEASALRREAHEERKNASSDPNQMSPEQRELYERTRIDRRGQLGGDTGSTGGTRPSGPADLEAARKAISTIESGSAQGNYGAVGPATKTGDRAHGRYQVMGANVPSWTKKYYGESLTPEQFRANPKAQDAVFDGEFGGYLKKYGPEGASRTWFSGSPTGGDEKKDVAGTSVKGYGSRFGKLYATYLGDAPTIAGGRSDEGTKTAQSPSGATTTTAPPEQQTAMGPSRLDPGRTKGVSSWLTDVANRALAKNPGLFVVNPDTEQVRTPEQQAEYKRKGWSQTDKSYHLAGNALDLVPINPKTGKPDADYKEGYQQIASAMRDEAARMGIKNLRWGGDWKSFQDMPHWELGGTSREYAGQPGQKMAAIPPPAVGVGAPIPAPTQTAEAVPLSEEEQMPATLFARTGGAIPSPKGRPRYATGGAVKKKAAPAKPKPKVHAPPAELGTAENADAMDQYEWQWENIQRAARGQEALAAPTGGFRERPVYTASMAGNARTPAGAVYGNRYYTGQDERPGEAVAIYRNARTDPGEVRLADGSTTTMAKLTDQWKRGLAEQAAENQRVAFARDHPQGAGAPAQGPATFYGPGVTAPNGMVGGPGGLWSTETGRAGTGAKPKPPPGNFHLTGPTAGTVWNSNPGRQGSREMGQWGDTKAMTPAEMGRAPATASATPAAQQATGAGWGMGGGGGSGSSAQPAGGGFKAGGMDPAQMGGDWARLSQGGGSWQPLYQQPMAVSDQWNPAIGSSQQMATPPVGTPQRPAWGYLPNVAPFHEGGGPVYEGEGAPYYVNGGAIPDGWHYFEGGTVRSFAPGGPVDDRMDPYMGRGGSEAQHGEVEAANAARQRLENRQGTYRQGLTQGDLDRARSDPSRYGPIFREGVRAGVRAETTGSTKKAGAKPAKSSGDRKDPSTTGSIGPSPGDPGLRRPYEEQPDDIHTYQTSNRGDPGLHRDLDSVNDPNSLTPAFGPGGGGAIPSPALPPAPPGPVMPPMGGGAGDPRSAQQPLNAAGLLYQSVSDALPIQAGGRALTTPEGLSAQPAVPGGRSAAEHLGAAANTAIGGRLDPQAGGAALTGPNAAAAVPDGRSAAQYALDAIQRGSKAIGGILPARAGGRGLTMEPVAPPGMHMERQADGSLKPVPDTPAMRRGGSVPARRFAPGGPVEPNSDEARMMSDPSRYGAEPPGAIPAPGGSPAAGVSAAPVAPQQQAASARPPRPEADSGYYQKPSREEIAALNKLGLDEIQRMVQGQGADQMQNPATAQAPGPAVGADPRQAVAGNAFGSNTMAPTPEVMQQAYQTVDPEGKLSTDELQLKTLQDLHDFWVSQGRTDKAATAAASVLLYGKKVAATSGAMALSAVQDGNVLRAAQWLSKGYAHIPNGESVRFEQNPDDPGKITYWKIGPDGKETQPRTEVGADEIGAMAKQMASGSGWLQETIVAAHGGRGGSARTPEQIQAQRDAEHERARKEKDTDYERTRADRQKDTEASREYARTEYERRREERLKEKGDKPGPEDEKPIFEARQAADAARDAYKVAEEDGDPDKMKAAKTAYDAAASKLYRALPQKDRDLRIARMGHNKFSLTGDTPAAAPGVTPATAPAGSDAAPPMAGARRAADGNWYVQQGGKWNRVDPG
jgi:hypothetical protein